MVRSFKRFWLGHTAWIALAWGICEGTWFFLVPDIYLSFIAISSLEMALFSAVAVVLGSMTAAVSLYFALDYNWTISDLISIWSALPGFAPRMLDAVSTHLTEAGASGLLAGPASGIPYKIYVAEAHQLKIPLSSVLLFTPLARLERILIAPLVVWLLRTGAARIWKIDWQELELGETTPSTTTKRKLSRILFLGVALYWIGTYCWYWGYFIADKYGRM